MASMTTNYDESNFFQGTLFQMASMTTNYDEIEKFQNLKDSQEPEVDAGF